MFIKIGGNIFNVNEIVHIFKCVDVFGDEFSIKILVKGCREEIMVLRSDNMQDINKEFERICSILIPES